MKLLFIGDVMLGRLVNERLKEAAPEYPWGDTLPVLQGADFRICNLECVISDRGSPWSATPKIFHYRTDSKNIEVLKAAGINGVSLANNHILDYEEDALLDCLRILDDNGIPHAGAGANIREAERSFVAEVCGMRVGFLAFTDNEPEWEAGENTPGTFYVPVDPGDWRAMRLMDLVRGLRDSVDIAIVAAHWGPNWGYPPLREHVEFAHMLVDAGADIIFGHSPHILRGVELYHGRPILYSAGNFVDDYAVDEVERNDQSCIFVLEVADGRFERLVLYPTIIESFQARMAPEIESEAIMRMLRRLCTALGTEVIRVDDHLEIPIGRQVRKTLPLAG